LLPGDNIDLFILKPHPETVGAGIDPVDDLIGEEQAFAYFHRGDMMRTAIAGTFADGDNLIISHMLKFDPLARDD
jgi:hypothetical protein